MSINESLEFFSFQMDIYLLGGKELIYQANALEN